MSVSTRRQREIRREWFNHTGFEFMEFDPNMTFYEKLMANREWLEDHATEALSIGDDVSNDLDAMTEKARR